MSRLPRFQDNQKVAGRDLNLILSILDSSDFNATTSATLSGLVGDSLNPTTPNLAGSIDPVPGAPGTPMMVRGFTGSYGIDNFSQSHTAYVILNWTPNPINDFVSRYDIYYHKGSDPTLYNLSVGGDVNGCRVNNLFPGNAYNFAIQAHDAANRASAWTPELTINISLDSDSPATPVGFTALAAGKGVYLNWVEVGPEGLSNDLKQYEIGVSLASSFSNVISGQRRITVPSANVAGNPTPWIVTVGAGNSFFYPYPGSNTTLFFRIRSVDWTGNKSDWSSVVSATTGGGGITWADISAGAPSSSMTGGLTITTGGLNVTGGATVTGNSTITGTLLVSGTVQVAGTGVDAPAGVLGYAQTTSAQGSITSEVDLTSLTVTVTVGAGRRIRVRGKVPWSSNTSNDVWGLSIKEGSTQLAQERFIMGSTANNGYLSLSEVILTPSTGSHTYKLTGQRVTGTGTLTTNVGTTNPAFIIAEDIGT